MKASTWKFELVLAVAMLAIGLVLLPVAVYWVGQFVVGGYEDDAGLGGLMSTIWLDLGRGRAAAWALVSSPYVIIQLARLALRQVRRPDSPAPLSRASNTSR